MSEKQKNNNNITHREAHDKCETEADRRIDLDNAFVCIHISLGHLNWCLVYAKYRLPLSMHAPLYGSKAITHCDMLYVQARI